MSQFDNVFGMKCLSHPVASSPVYPALGKGNPSSDAALEQNVFEEMCPVCGDKVSGYHYGLLTCESCKGFFKRTVQNKKVYSCVENKKCPIDKSQRKRCPFCRYQKCLKVGMRLDAVRSDRMRGGRNKFGPMYKQDRARKQQLQAFHRATGFLRVIDPGGTLHSALEKSLLFGSVRDWMHEEKPQVKPPGPHILLDNRSIETANLWPYTAPQIFLPSAGSHSRSNQFSTEIHSGSSSDSRPGLFPTHLDSKRFQYLGFELRDRKDSFIEDLQRNSIYGGANATDAQKREAFQHPGSSPDNLFSRIHQDSHRHWHGVNLDAGTRPIDISRLTGANTAHPTPDITTGDTQHSYFPPTGYHQTIFASNTSPIGASSRKSHQENVPVGIDNCERYGNATLHALLKCEIDEKEAQSRTLAAMRATPDQGFVFVCDVTNQALFLLVEWAKSSAFFQELKTSDQMILLQNGWMDILVLDHAFRQMEYLNDTIVLPTGHSFPSDFFERFAERSFAPKQDTNAVKDILHKFSELTSKIRNLHLDRVEFVCLKSIILFNTDASLESKPQLKKTQELINSALWDYSLKRELPNRERISQIFCTLCDIRSISILCEDHLLREYHNGNTPTNNLLMEMFHAKRNVAVR